MPLLRWLCQTEIGQVYGYVREFQNGSIGFSLLKWAILAFWHRFCHVLSENAKNCPIIFPCWIGSFCNFWQVTKSIYKMGHFGTPASIWLRTSQKWRNSPIKKEKMGHFANLLVMVKSGYFQPLVTLSETGHVFEYACRCQNGSSIFPFIASQRKKETRHSGISMHIQTRDLSLSQPF